MKKTALALVAVFFLVGRAYGQTATPTPTPTDTPTPTETPTPTVTPTATPILTNPFRFDNLQTKVETWLGITQSQAPLAPVNDGRVIYDTGVQDFMCSKNGGAYAACVPTPVPTPTASAGGSCPAGSDTDIQFNDGGSACGGEANFIYNKDGGVSDNNPSATLSSSTAAKVPAFSIGNSSNTSGSGSFLQVYSGGTSATGGNAILFNRGAADAVPQYFQIEQYQPDGRMLFHLGGPSNHNPSGADQLLALDPSGNKQVRVATGGNSTTVPDLAYTTDADTGFSRTTSGGGEVQQNIIVHNLSVVDAERTGGSAVFFDVNWRTAFTPDASNVFSTAGPTTFVVDHTFYALSSTNGGGTAVQISTTSIRNGQYVQIMNIGTNELTIADGSGAGFCEKTTGAATQHLPNKYDNISFIAYDSCWIQHTPVAGP